MTDKKRPGFIDAKRRGFLQGAVLTGGAVAAGAAANAGPIAPTDTPVPAPENEQRKGYQRTEHVARYYERARY